MESLNRIVPKQTWRNLEDHYLKALADPWYKSLSEIQNLISLNTTLFYKEKNIKTLHLPITTNSISSPMGLGSDSSPIKVDISNVDTYLADSMQFMLEYGCRLFDNGCYYIMPSFRGEPADERHLCQFYHSEAEIPGTLDDVINLVEEYIKFLSAKILDEYEKELILITGGDIEHIRKIASLKSNFNRITFDNAVEILENNPEYIRNDKLGFRTINKYGEQKLISLFEGIVWVTNYDYLALPFYQAIDKNNRNKALNADLLFGIGEVVGCGERHTNSADVIESLKRHNVEKDDYRWYIEMKNQYPIKTSGFGLGTERFILWLTKQNDIRDCQLLPRFNGVNIIP